MEFSITLHLMISSRNILYIKEHIECIFFNDLTLDPSPKERDDGARGAKFNKYFK